MKYVCLLIINQFLFSGSWFLLRYCADRTEIPFCEFWFSKWGIGFVLLYALASFNALILIRKVKLVRLAAISSALAILLTILSGVFLLDEPFPFKNFVLLSLALLALLFFYLGQHQNARKTALQKDTETTEN